MKATQPSAPEWTCPSCVNEKESSETPSRSVPCSIRTKPHNPPDELEPPLTNASNCPNAYDDVQSITSVTRILSLADAQPLDSKPLAPRTSLETPSEVGWKDINMFRNAERLGGMYRPVAMIHQLPRHRD